MQAHRHRPVNPAQHQHLPDGKNRPFRTKFHLLSEASIKNTLFKVFYVSLGRAKFATTRL